MLIIEHDLLSVLQDFLNFGVAHETLVHQKPVYCSESQVKAFELRVGCIHNNSLFLGDPYDDSGVMVDQPYTELRILLGPILQILTRSAKPVSANTMRYAITCIAWLPGCLATVWASGGSLQACEN